VKNCTEKMTCLPRGSIVAAALSHLEIETQRSLNFLDELFTVTSKA